MSIDNQNSQKFIGKERAPRVQIEYDVEVYGSQKKVELPFVVGVMSDLSGDRLEDLDSVEERKFLEMDMDNFDERMRAISPRVHTYVKDTLSGGDDMVEIDMSFGSMEDFEPEAVARNIPQLNTLLDARAQLQQLLTYMDGKASAEQIVERLIADPGWIEKLANDPDAYVPLWLILKSRPRLRQAFVTAHQ